MAQSLEEMKTVIIENINFRSGVIEESIRKVPWYKIILDVRWKGNVHLEVYDRGGWSGRYCYTVSRNGERVSASYRSNKPDEKFFKSLQKLVDEIENGDFDKKKTHSEQVMEIVQKRNLTSYMNQTKWKEFLHAMTEEMSITIPYDYKTLFEDSRENLLWGTSYDIESFNYYDFKSFEWVKVKPRFEEHIHQGRIMDDKIVRHDVEAEFLALMDKYKIPYEYDSAEDLYVIYGYK